MADRGLGVIGDPGTLYAGDYTRTYINQNYPGATYNIQRISGTGNAAYLDLLIEAIIAFYVYNGTTWKDATNAKVYTGSAWKDMDGSKVYNGTDWVNL